MASGVWGESRLAQSLREELVDVPVESCVLVVEIDAGSRPLSTITDSDIETVWEQPMRRLLLAMVGAKLSGCTRIVVVVPTIALSGGSAYVLQSALAEAAHVLVKSAARQWGVDGVVVNCVVLAPGDFGIDTELSGDVSLAPRALPNAPSAAEAISWLCSESALSITGQTIVVDGGLWM